MVPAFPDFTPLTIAHKQAFEKMIHRYPPYSDFNFTSLYCWDIDQAVAISELHGNLIVRFSDYVSDEVFLSLLGEGKLLQTLDTLTDYCIQQDMSPLFRLIPHSVIQQLPLIAHEHYRLEEDRDNHDYMLSVQELVAFRTNQFRGKKNAYNRFVRSHAAETHTALLAMDDPDTLTDIRRVTTDWQYSRNKADPEVRNEVQAIERCVTQASKLGVQGFGLFMQDQMVAFTLFELVPQHTALIHFDKANVDFIGIFAYLKHHFALYLSTLGIEFINYEQDLGIPGLRAHKQSYKPIDFLKKYTIVKRS